MTLTHTTKNGSHIHIPQKRVYYNNTLTTNNIGLTEFTHPNLELASVIIMYYCFHFKIDSNC